MGILKIVLLTMVLAMCSFLGIIKANRFKLRVVDLTEIKKALNLILTKMRYTYEPLPELFKDVSKELKANIANIFITAHTYMNELSAKEAWEKSVTESNNNFTNEDINIIKGLGNLLGKTDLEGQLMLIELTTKLYKTLGTTRGLAIMIIFI